MELGFNSLKDILDVVVIPLVLAILALAWPSIQSWYRGRAFKGLIFRELGELAPHDKIMKPGHYWWDHQNKTFIHQKIFQNPIENRDFILSLDPNLVYFVSQLWDERERKEPNGEQWLWLLGQIRDKYGSTIDQKKRTEESKPNEEGINEVYNAWDKLIHEYISENKKEKGIP
jgi:hypothetical protein